MSKEGKLIVKADPREILRQHQETADWEFRDEAAFWYGISQKMDERFSMVLYIQTAGKFRRPSLRLQTSETKTQLPSTICSRMNMEL